MFIKYLQITKIYSNPKIILYSNINNIIILILILITLFFKSIEQTTLLSNLFIFFFINFFFINYINNSNNDNNFFVYILPFFISFTYIFNLIYSIFSFFFLIEFYGILYFFFYSSISKNSFNSILQYKNTILLLLWNNFITTLLFCIGLYWLIKIYGTTNFLELEILCYKSLIFIGFLLSIFWKVGFPLFHFFKLEVYKYLSKENLFLFSLLTMLINFNLIFFFSLKYIILNTLQSYIIYIIPLIFFLCLLLSSLNIINLLHYFALSSIITIFIIILLFSC